MKVRVTQIDGKLPNLALMRLAAWHRSQGDEVYWQRGVTAGLFEPPYDIVYGSAIFADSAKAVELFRHEFPGAIVGGSGGDAALRVEDIVPSQFTALDYTGYPDFAASIGYAMRGCRFKCGFCVVPKQEGKARSASPILQIWRGPGHPKHIHLLDNDFFGNPEWRDRVQEIRDGGFKICINQGVNVRLLDDEQAAAIVALNPWDDNFARKRLYCAWDNIGDEAVFFDGVERLQRAGWKPQWIMAYMLVGYDPRETWDRIWHRYNRMKEMGIKPFPMVFGGDAKRPKPKNYAELKRFQRWAVTPAQAYPFAEYTTGRIKNELVGQIALDMMPAPNGGRG